MTCVVVTALCNQPEAFSSNLDDGQSHYVYIINAKCRCSVRTKSSSEKQAKNGHSWVHWGSLISLLVIVDVVWFAHRMACTYSTVKLVLYGQIAYIECRRVTTGACLRLSFTAVQAMS